MEIITLVHRTTQERSYILHNISIETGELNTIYSFKIYFIGSLSCIVDYYYMSLYPASVYLILCDSSQRKGLENLEYRTAKPVPQYE